MKTHIQVRSVGKAQELWGKEAINMYATRCSLFGKIELIEVAEGHEGSVKPNLAKAKQTEAESLLNKLPKDAYLIALDEGGKQLDSQEFSSTLEREASTGRPVVFIIGGSWGLDNEVLKTADLKLSLGKITLPHTLARIVLLEQIYRAQMISAGREYHK
ncbi:MAG: 23S rRNA (pseudouridine(1915)-N(3))-methyltransferase RlmH [Patescibacteria group bacterium]|nr:23S rRNA (pseudouridine(1915)-N(3))-methyltransferase RlmH [Patescibacteria group bacterium]